MAESIAESPAPVMDVVAPPAEKTAKEDKADDHIDPLDQLAAEDQKTRQATEHKTEKPSAPEHHSTAKHTDTHGSSVGLAIMATVIIVLGLAALATYAYLQTSA